MEYTLSNDLKHFNSSLSLMPAISQELARTLRVAAYIRVSTENKGQENSYENQYNYFLEYISSYPLWVCAGIYSDYGISGTSKERRKGFERLLRHCKEGRIDRIVTKSISRFARNTRDFLKAMEILKQCHVSILFENERLDTAVAQNELITTAFAAVAQEESRSIAANIRQGIQHRFPKGEARNVVVYGYRYVQGNEAIETMESGYRRRQIEIVEDEAVIVRRIFSEAEQGRGFTEIARKLNLDCIPKPKTPLNIKRSKMEQTPVGTLNTWIDEGWTARQIKQILRLERYCGDALLQKTFTLDYKTHKSVKNTGELPQYYIKDNHPAIISREQFKRVQSFHLSKDNKSKAKLVHPFSCRLVCSQCGRFYITRNRKNHPIWACSSTSRNNGKVICRAERIYEEQLIRVCRKAIVERFDIIRRNLRDYKNKSEYYSEQFCDELSSKNNFKNSMDYININCSFASNSSVLLKNLLERLEQVHFMDNMEHDLTFLKRQISKTMDKAEQYCQVLAALNAARDTAQVRRELLHESISENEIKTLKEQVNRAEQQMENNYAEIQKLTKKKEILEQYWTDLEADYDCRKKAIAWMKTLPSGQGGIKMFLNDFTNEYLKAFILYIEVISPLKYKVRWFDNVWTVVEMHSNVDQVMTND